ncbi:hypothetical protein HNQ94_003404 [Salirhabdus euzebyi]|uniref:Uncharacterized protein n=1 Tax=Salirhabdus euzebyi TaxID=394506 RepID=A0A841Q966_9BACI|nr:hypothetical protein [Salirhabdus euzebyi]MBB6454915.1 hypothetical protein [Salirhabdus euzebyi]
MLSKKMIEELQKFIDQHSVILEFNFSESENLYSYDDLDPQDIEEFMEENREPSFAEVLFGFIDKRGYSDTEVYKRAGMDRRHFSKIRSNPDYKLRKSTVVALAFALELNKKETEQLLESAGFSLNHHDTFDLIIQFHLKKKIYDLDHVNEALEYFSVKTLF